MRLWRRTPSAEDLIAGLKLMPSPARDRLSRLLTEKRVCFLPAGLSREQIIGRLVGILDLRDPTHALKAVLAREAQAPTVIVSNVALPHARLGGISQFMLALGIVPDGVLEARVAGGKPLRIFLLLLSPMVDNRRHLAFMAFISFLFHHRALERKLLSARTPRAVLRAIYRAEQVARIDKPCKGFRIIPE